MKTVTDFSQIRTSNDILQQKALLRRQIAVKEQVLQRDFTQVKKSFSVLGLVGRSISYLTGFSKQKNPLRLFKLGFNVARALVNWRKR